MLKIWNGQQEQMGMQIKGRQVLGLKMTYFEFLNFKILII